MRRHRHLHPEAVRIARELLEGTALEGELDCLLAQAVPVIHLEPKEKEGRGISRIGGRALLPEGAEWPTWDPTAVLNRKVERREKQIAQAVSGKRPMPAKMLESWRTWVERLHAQVRLGRRGLTPLATVDLGEASGAELPGLPTTGILWLFADPEVYVAERESWLVLWRDDVTADALLPARMPANTRLFPETRVTCVPGAFVRGNAHLKDGTVVRELDDYSPNEPDLEDFESVEEWQAMCKTRRADEISPRDLVGRLNRTLFGGSQSLGHKTDEDEWCRPRMYSTYLDSQMPREQRRDEKDWERIAQEAESWRCLFVLDSDEETFGEGWKWGDMGQLQVWIEGEDLAGRRFGNTQLYCNTT